MSGVYVHIPYCRRKCLYCDFYSTGSKNAPWKAYVDAIKTEASVRADEFDRCKRTDCRDAHHSAHFDTLYIGGGTPSQMPVELLGNMIVGITDAFNEFNPGEITVEVNPEDVSRELCLGLAAAGVNRVSMGIQSLDDAELHAVGRSHTAAQALKAYEILRQQFDNISIDLIFGLPLQTPESWDDTLRQAIDMNAEHISAYSLMWEERTALYKMQQLGKVDECDEDISEQMFSALTEALDNAGYEHYEISNFAKPGYRSAHNSSYWTGVPYIGLGAAAHSYDGETIRRANPADVKAYISHYRQPVTTPCFVEEHLTAEELHEEYIMTRLRRREGIDTSDYRARFGEPALMRFLTKAKQNPALLRLTYSREGNNASPASVSLTRESVMRSDTAILALL